MDTVRVRHTASQISGGCHEIAQALRGLTNASHALHESWHGLDAHIFLGDLEHGLKQLTHRAEQGVGLGAQLRREIEAWERTASVLAEAAEQSVND